MLKNNYSKKKDILIHMVLGLFALEALDMDEEASQICGFCGIAPELCLGIIA